jgi:hypothetical protein
LLPPQPPTDLLNFLTCHSPFDACHHPALRRCEVNVTTYASKCNPMLISERKELLQFNRTPMQPIEIPDNDSIGKSFG